MVSVESTEGKGRDFSSKDWMSTTLASTSLWNYFWQPPVSLDISTADNYKSDHFSFYGKFAKQRSRLDYSYHVNYIQSRQLLQDKIIDSYLNEVYITDINGEVCQTSTEPWIVFTAGAMGAGKSHTIRRLAAQGVFPLHSFVRVDPDAIRLHLPEFSVYVQSDPLKAGELTSHEAGYVSEILTEVALKEGRNVLVDGSLRDSDWYKSHFEELRKHVANLRIGIFYVTAPREEVFKRAEARSKTTGRTVPRETLELALEQVPKSIQILEPLSDFFCELHNPPGAQGIQLRSNLLTWESFKSVWVQTCARNSSQDL